MELLNYINACNGWNEKNYYHFVIDGKKLGFTRPEFAERLQEFRDTFLIRNNTVELIFPGSSDEKTQRIRQIARELGLPLKGEDYSMVQEWGGQEFTRLDRSHVPYFGIKAHGVHLIGYVQKADGLYLWLGKRSKDKPVAPGQLDNLVAGGQPAGFSLPDNLAKECAEEADIPEELAKKAALTGLVSYKMDWQKGMRNDVLFCYDLEMPSDFVPRNTDGEVEEFILKPIEEVQEMLRNGADFKFNVPLVIIDFLIRRGFITPENERNYCEIVTRLRS